MTTTFSDLGTNDPNIIALTFSGTLTKETMAELDRRVEVVAAAGGKARIYLDIQKFSGLELGVIAEKLRHLKTLWSTIERMAYVVDADWITKVVDLLGAAAPMHVRAFRQDDAEAARSWLLSSDEPEASSAKA